MKIVLIVGLAGLVISVIAPIANADPCDFPSTMTNWYDPCTSQFPPWHDPNWNADGKPGTWGPNGYTPCEYMKGECG